MKRCILPSLLLRRDLLSFNQSRRYCPLGKSDMTRAELMRHALTQALRRVHDLAGKKLKLDEEAPMRLPKRGGRQARDQRVINVCFAPEKRILRYARGTLPSRRLTVGGKA